MSIESRLNKIESVTNADNAAKHNAVIIIDKSDRVGLLKVRISGETAFEGTQDEIETFLEPYRAGESVIITNEWKLEE